VIPKQTLFQYQLGYVWPTQCRINNSSRCSNCYWPRALEGPAVFCIKFYLLQYKIVFSLWSQYFAKFATSS